MRGKKELRNIKREFEEAGSPEAHLKVWERLSIRLDQIIQRCTEMKLSFRSNFKSTLETWTGKPVQGDPRPCAISGDVRIARFYFWAGVIAIAFESMIGAWLAERNGVPWWAGGLIAAGSGALIKGLILLFFRRVSRPKESLRRIRTWITAPAAVLFGLSFVLFLAARIVTGPVAIMLIPLFNASLLTLSLGLLLMAGAFFANQRILMWSAHDEADYDALEKKEVAARGLRAELVREVSLLASSLSTMTSSPSVTKLQAAGGSHGPGSSVPVIAIALFIPLLAISNACSPSSAATVTPCASMMTSDKRELFELKIDGDSSKSLDDAITRKTTEAITEYVPTVAEEWPLKAITASIFDRDGWKNTETFHRDLHPMEIASATKIAGGDASSLKNIKEAVDEQNRKLQSDCEEQARSAFRSRLRQDLEGLSADALLPPPGYPEPPHTDLNGEFRRVSMPAKDTTTLQFVVTDGDENYTNQLQPIPAPSGRVALVVVLVPESTAEQKRPTLGYKEFETRKALIMTAIPWAVVIPYFDTDYDSALKTALSKMSAVQTSTRQAQ